MDIAITGASGLIGSHLARALTKAGHRPIAVVRRAASSTDEISWDPAEGAIDGGAFEGLDAVVNLAGAPIGDKRWSEQRRQELYDSRINSTRLLVETFAQLDRPPKVFVSGSAVGFYGNRGDQELNEHSARGSGFLADLCVAWEAEAMKAADLGIRTTTIRTGIVLSQDGGALPKMLPLFRFGLGGRFASGTQWWPWIALADQVAAIEFLLANDISGPVNLTAPNPVTSAEFTSTLAKVLRRPAIIPIPAFGPKLLVGSELAQALLFDSARVIPMVLTDKGFSFTYSTLQPALTDIATRASEVA